jgi:hypothetical protein
VHHPPDQQHGVRKLNHLNNSRFILASSSSWINNPWLIAVVGGVVAIAVAGLWSRPRKWIVEFVRAGRNRPRDKFHLIVGATWPTFWTRVVHGEQAYITWQCQLHITNGGTRVNAPVTGVLRWRGGDCTFDTRMMFETMKARQVLNPTERAQFMVNALSPIAYDQALSGDIDAKLTVTDQYGNEEHLNIKFPEEKSPECQAAVQWQDSVVSCDQLAGHSGPHMTQKWSGRARVVVRWDDDERPTSFVMA